MSLSEKQKMRCTDCRNCKTEYFDKKDGSRRIACKVKPCDTVYKRLGARQPSEVLEKECPLYAPFGSGEGNFWDHVSDGDTTFTLLGKGNK